MFNYKVEDLVLLKDKVDKFNPIFRVERETSREDKLEFVDKKTDGAVSYLIDLAEKFTEAKKTMPKDKYGRTRTVSIKAWIKKNDTRNLVDGEYSLGQTRFMVKRHIENINSKGRYDFYDDFVDEVFHEILTNLRKEERAWFRNNDPYLSLEEKVRTQLVNMDFLTFGNRISYGSDGVFLATEDDKKRKLTYEELRTLIDLNNRVKDFIANLTAKTDKFDIDNPKGEMPDEKVIKLAQRN